MGMRNLYKEIITKFGEIREKNLGPHQPVVHFDYRIALLQNRLKIFKRRDAGKLCQRRVQWTRQERKGACSRIQAAL